MPHYTQEQIEMANNADLVKFLNQHAEHLKRCGTQYLWEKHQVWIRENRWYTHYDSVGGYAIGFVMKYYAFSFQDAVAELADNREKLFAMKQENKKLSTEYSVEKHIRKLCQIYREQDRGCNRNETGHTSA